MPVTINLSISMFQVVVLCALISLVASHAGFRDLIPNGHSVPNPCNPGSIWNGVGHAKASGAGSPLNPFGEDFRNGGFIWNHKLCMMDSDLDGLSNGAELGDPHCHWKPGDAPLGNAIGHPGICEPLTDATCITVNARIACH